MFQSLNRSRGLSRLNYTALFYLLNPFPQSCLLTRLTFFSFFYFLFLQYIIHLHSWMFSELIIKLRTLLQEAGHSRGTAVVFSEDLNPQSSGLQVI